MCKWVFAIEILKKNSHRFLTFTLIFLLLSLFLLVSLSLSPLWNYGSCLLQNWRLQTDPLSSVTVHSLYLDFNLSQNQSHSQATQPFCTPTLCCSQDGNACWMPMRDMTSFSNSAWCISGGDRSFICIIFKKLSSVVCGLSYRSANQIN